MNLRKKQYDEESQISKTINNYKDVIDTISTTQDWKNRYSLC